MFRAVDFVLRAASPRDAEELAVLIGEIRKESRADNHNEEAKEQQEHVVIKHKTELDGQVILARVRSKRLVSGNDRISTQCCIQMQEKGSNLLVGYARATANGLKSSHVFELKVFVRKSHRGAELGRALLDAATEAAEKSGAERLEATVFSSNHGALNMYERAGFLREGLKRRSSKTYSGAYHDSILMARIVKAEVANSDPHEGTEVVAPISRRSGVAFDLVPATPQDARAMVVYLDVTSRETEVTHVDLDNVSWMKEEEQFIREKSTDSKNVLFINSWVCTVICHTSYRTVN